MTFCQEHELQTILKISVQPNAKKSEIIGPVGDPVRLKIKIKAKPMDGEANAEVIKFFSKILETTQRSIVILRGEKSKNKDLLIDLKCSIVKKNLSTFITSPT